MRWKCENECLKAEGELTLSSQNNQKTHFGQKQTMWWGHCSPASSYKLKNEFEKRWGAYALMCASVCVRGHDIIPVLSNQGETEPTFALGL